MLERQIVPTLVVNPETIKPQCPEHTDQTEATMAMALQGRVPDAEADLRELFLAGASFDDLQLGLLAPAAERLGTLWDTDVLSFVDVTVATGTLQRLMHFVAIDLADTPMLGGKRSICIFPEPCAEHTFGASMAAKFFQRAGWQVEYVPTASPARLREIVRGRHIDVLGLSLSRGEQSGRAEGLLRDLKAASRNPDLISVAGGNAFAREPVLIGNLSVDAILAAITSAPNVASNLVAEKQR